MNQNVLAYAYFHAPNFILAALMYTTIGRLAFRLVVPEDWDNYIYRFFVRITDPVVKPVRYVTPSILSDHVVLVFAALWLLAARFAFGAILFKMGALPQAA